ncbi:MAG: hypothetical protein EXR67_05230 [Dehalococcoidia bacterium]|nr:hypothetical protein [Dehalococcoidia bacterium]
MLRPTEDLRRSREAGFDFHLVKPVTLQALQSVLQFIQASIGQRDRAPKKRAATRRVAKTHRRPAK